MNRLLENIISVSFIPIIILNIGGAIVGAIWLFVIGEWKLVIGAFIISCIFPFVYSLIMLIQLPLDILLGWFVERKKKSFVAITGFVNMLIGHIAGLGWVFLVFTYAIILSEKQTSIPYLLFGWEVATGPFQYMASKEPPDSIGTYAAVYLLQIAYLIFVIFFFLGIFPLTIPVVILITLFLEIFLIKIALQSQELETPELQFNIGEEPYPAKKELSDSNFYCSHCGTKIKKGGTFCTQCGRKI